LHREPPFSDYTIQRALDALHRGIQWRDAEIDRYRRLLAAERDGRHDAEARARRAERALAQYAPTVALDLTPATRPDLYSVAEGAA
jgi:hypothetical protein